MRIFCQLIVRLRRSRLSGPVFYWRRFFLGSCLGLLILSLESLVQGAESPADPPGDPRVTVRKSVTFIGFAAKGAVNAWLVEVVREQYLGDNRYLVDSYPLYKFIETKTREVKGVYRAGEIKRRQIRWVKKRSPAGGESGAAPAQEPAELQEINDEILTVPLPSLAAANPEWEAAQPLSEWRRLNKRYRFSKKIAPIENNTIRLARDDDVQAEIKGEKKRIVVHGESGSPLGFSPIVRLMNGKYLELGHYRVEGLEGQALESTVEIYYAPSAKQIAVLCHFFKKAQPAEKISMGTALELPSPLGITLLGALEVNHELEKNLQELFHELHPDQAIQELYDHYVGPH